MRIAITGSSGLIGTACAARCLADGHDIVRFVRHELPQSDPADAAKPPLRYRGLPRYAPKPKPVEKYALWDPEQGEMDAFLLEGVDAVVHLAGANIGEGRWTYERKAEILESRVQGTRTVCETIARLQAPPKVLVSASAIGWYGDRGDEFLDEDSDPGEGFLAEVCREWEAATQPAWSAGIRVVLLRFGVVLDARQGALARMLPVFRAGYGGRIGSGRAYMSWIAIEDAASAIAFCIETPSLAGPVNAVAPTPVTNAEFTRALAEAVGKSPFLPVPAFALRMMFGEMADELMLSSARVMPERLATAGFMFKHPTIEAGLRAAFSRRG